MKKFTFRLQVVLDRALDEEEKQQQLLAKLRNELLAKEREISDVNCKREQTMGLVMHMQDGAFEAHQMHAAYLHLEGLGNDLADLATQRREIDGRVGAKQREVIEAMRKRQVLEKLREKQLQAYKKSVEQFELQTMEEAVLPRLARQQAAERARLEEALRNGDE